MYICISGPPSAELRLGQKTTCSMLCVCYRCQFMKCKSYTFLVASSSWWDVNFLFLDDISIS